MIMSHSLPSIIKHVVHVMALLTLITLLEYGSFCQGERRCVDQAGFYVEQYGTILTAIITSIQLLVVLTLPQIICNVLGLILFNAFPGEIKIKLPPSNKTISNSLDSDGDSDIINNGINKEKFGREKGTLPSNIRNAPHLCFRIVTRGLYPELVVNNIQRNYLTCIESGLSDFALELVTDKEIYLSNPDERVRQLVVPTTYRSSTGALFKARALQYALEPGVSPARDEDYIVHLDEETIVSKNVIYGILNFALDGKHAFGQGLITYANLEIVNLLTTLADSYRVADDMGKLRFQLAALHKPIFGWKGSFVVTKCGPEKDVSFDHGLNGSIAEDCYFSMVAFNKGYTFDFIDGEMYEKSPFTIMDLIRQRKRWIQGIWLVVHTSKIPIRTKFFLIMSHYAWLTLPLTSLSFVTSTIFPIATPLWLQSAGVFCFAVTLYMYFFGLLKSFDLKSRPTCMLFVYLVGQLFTLPLNIIMENVAVIWGLTTPKHNFYIVKKDVKPSVLSP